jgi:hypothetical protein
MVLAINSINQLAVFMDTQGFLCGGGFEYTVATKREPGSWGI